MIKQSLIKAMILPALCVSSIAMADWPVAITDQAVSSQDRVSYPIYIDVLENDIGDQLEIIEANQTSENGGFIRRVNYRTLGYTRPSGFSGEDGFWYAMKDAQGRTNAIRVSVNVKPAGSRMPDPQEDKVETPRDTAIRINVLKNDLFSDGFISRDGRQNNYGVITQYNEWSEKGGQIEKVKVFDNPYDPVLEYQLRYTPAAGFSGVDTFWYAVKNTSGGTEHSTKVTINVLETSEISDPYPIARADVGNFSCVRDFCSIDESTVKYGNSVIENDTGKGLLLTAGSSWSLRGGKVSIFYDESNNLPKISYQPPSNYTGEDKVWYTIEDKYGRKNWGVFTINIANADG